MISGIRPDLVKSFPSDEEENQCKPSEKFRKSKFYIRPQQEGEGSSKNAKMILEYPISSTEYSIQSLEYNSQLPKYIFHSPEYYISQKKKSFPHPQSKLKYLRNTLSST